MPRPGGGEHGGEGGSLLGCWDIHGARQERKRGDPLATSWGPLAWVWLGDPRESCCQGWVVGHGDVLGAGGGA